MRPPVGLNTSPRTPFPAPFTRLSSPSFLAPADTDRGGYQLLAFVCDSPLIGCEITPVTPANTPCLEKNSHFFLLPTLSVPPCPSYRNTPKPGSSIQTLFLPQYTLNTWKLLSDPLFTLPFLSHFITTTIAPPFKQTLAAPSRLCPTFPRVLSLFLWDWNSSSMVRLAAVSPRTPVTLPRTPLIPPTVPPTNSLLPSTTPSMNSSGPNTAP